MNSNDTYNRWPLIVVLLIWVVILGLSYFSYRPPQPRLATVPSDEFSAKRAEPFLVTLVGDGIPHPAGTDQNKVVRRRVVEFLESEGYDVEIQTGIGTVLPAAKSRSPDRDRVDLSNIIAIRKSQSSDSNNELPAPKSKSVLLMAHYDSIPYGPGASDDGVAVAALLEIARMLANEPPPSRDVIFLFTDGEEFGLLGAKLFVDENPLLQEVGIVINLEARGTTGPSCMFETSNLSRQLVPIYSRSARLKFASSMFAEVYRRMPNDTDFSMFKRAGKIGLNFAFIGGVNRYHTPLDNLENVDHGSLQHHGDNALGLLRELLASPDTDDLIARGTEEPDEAVYFDLFGRWIFWWPSQASIWMSGLAALLWGFIFFRRTRQGESDSEQRWAELAIHVGLSVMTFGFIFAVGFLLQKAVALDERFAHPWPEHPVPILAAYWCAAVAVISGVAIAFTRWLKSEYVLLSFLLVWVGLAAATSIYVNGASHLFIVPVLLTAFAGAAIGIGNARKMGTVFLVAAITVGLIWLPMERLFYDAVGFRMPVAMQLRIAIVTSSLLGLFSLVPNKTRFRLAMLMSIVSVVGLVYAIVLA